MIWLQSLTIPLSVSSTSGDRLLGLALDLALLAGAEVVDDAPEVGLLDHGARLAVARPHVGEDVVAQPHHELVAGREVHRLDRVEAGEVVGVLHRDAHRALAPLERGAQVLLQEVGGDALLDLRGHRGAGRLPVPAAEELAQRPQDLLLRDARLLDQDLRDVQLVDARGLDPPSGGPSRRGGPCPRARRTSTACSARRTVLVVEGDAEDLRELLRRLLVARGESGAAPLVDELENAQQVLVEHDAASRGPASVGSRSLVPASRRSAGSRGASRAQPRRRRLAMFASCGRGR